MPIPLITILQNGKGFLGKQSLVKEFILMPKQNSNIQLSVDKISKINRIIRDGLYQSKTFPGACNKCVTDNGSYTCLLDTYQQGFEIIENAIGMIFPEGDNEIEMAINIGASEIFDAEKNKYEVSIGVLKSIDEMIELFIEMITKNPRIKMIIDPFNLNEPIAWYKLYSRIHKQCLIANTFKTYDNTNQIEKSLDTQKTVEEQTDENKQNENIIQSSHKIIMPVNFFKYENSITVTSFNQKIKEMQEKNVACGIASNFHETDDTFIADLSVANQVKYIKIGGFNRNERVNKLNRLLEIESILTNRNMLYIDDGKITEEKLTEIEIPKEHVESIQAYIHSIEEKHGKISKALKN